MHYNKKRIIVLSVIITVAALSLTAACFIYDINKRFPEPTVQVYDKDTPAEENGLVITPVECRLYTYDEYYRRYGEEGVFAYAEMYAPEMTRLLSFVVEFENVSDDVITYETDSFNMTTEKIGANNGVLLEENKSNKAAINPGEKQSYTLSTLVLARTIVKAKWIDRLDEETFYLVYNWYPVTKKLKFEVSL